MIKNIIFDWSGVISDDFICVYKACMIVMKKLMNKEISLEQFKRDFVLPYMNFWHKYLPKVTKEEIDKLYHPAIHEVGEPLAYSGIKKVLVELKKNKINMIIVSSCVQKKLDKEVMDYGLADIFQEVNGSVHNKAEEIHEILKRNKFKPLETAYLGDMDHDIEAGKAAGVKTMAACWGYQSKESLRKMNPDLLVESISDISLKLLV